MNLRGTWRVRVGLVCVCLFAGCPEKQSAAPRKIEVYAIEVRDRSPLEGRLSDTQVARFEQAIAQRLNKSADFRLIKQRKDGAYRIQLEGGAGEGRGQGPAVVMLVGRAKPYRSPNTPALQATTVSEIGSGRLDGAKREEHWARVVDRVVTDLMFQGHLVIGPDKDVVAALGGDDENRLAPAIEVAALRRVGAAVPKLIVLLKHEKPQISDRAIGALTAIGDRRAVKPLTRLSKFSDTARMAKVLDAIGTLGGDEAQQYLEFVATGHEDDDIRNLAKEALDRMGRRASSRR